MHPQCNHLNLHKTATFLIRDQSNYKSHNALLNCLLSGTFIFILTCYKRSVKGLWKSLQLVTYCHQRKYIERDLGSINSSTTCHKG